MTLQWSRLLLLLPLLPKIITLLLLENVAYVAVKTKGSDRQTGDAQCGLTVLGNKWIFLNQKNSKKTNNILIYANLYIYM